MKNNKYCIVACRKGAGRRVSGNDILCSGRLVGDDTEEQSSKYINRYGIRIKYCGLAGRQITTDVAVGFGSRSSVCLVWIGFRSGQKVEEKSSELTSTQMDERLNQIETTL